MLIAPTNAIHTFFMKFPIDVVFVSRAGGVLKIRHSMPAWRIAGSLRGFAVAELAGGSAVRAGLVEGDQLRVEPTAGGSQDDLRFNSGHGKTAG